MLDAAATKASASDFLVHDVVVAGAALVVDRSGVLYWPDENALIVADLHLEKGSAAAVRGRMLPPYDTRETLMRLAAVIERYTPRTVIALGDSLHDVGAGSRIDIADQELLAGLQRGRSWIWVRGNHDPEIAACLGGEVVGEVETGGLVLRHEPSSGAAKGEIAGHLHPAAKISARGGVARRRCFIHDASRLVMPAFGAFAGGLNVLDPAFTPLFRGELAILMLGAAGIYPISTGLLVTD